MLAGLRERRVGAVELTELHIRRIQVHDRLLNAVVTKDFERARDRAQQADARRSGAPRDGILGLPFTVKDSIEVEGLVATGGLPQLAGNVSAETAPAIGPLLSGGGVLLGKTNVPPRVVDWQTDNRVFGRTSNPWDLGRTPGGSTGGGAAAVAAGLSPLEIGTDMAGSIRIPAAFCGIFGHRPSAGVVPRGRQVPGGERANPAAPLSVVGPLARSAADLELALDLIAGPGPGERAGWRLKLPAPRPGPVGWRVAVLPEAEWLPVDAGIRASLEEVAALCRLSGMRVEEAAPTGFDLRRNQEVFTALVTVQGFANTDAEVRDAAARTIAASGDEFAEARLHGLNATAGDLLTLLDLAVAERGRWSAFFGDWDLVLMPATFTNAFPHVGGRYYARMIDVDDRAVPYNRLEVHPGVAALPGLPVSAFPAGRSQDGLPVGLQVMGPYLGDRTTIAFASEVEHELGGFTPPPEFT
jgi:amidase